MARLWQWLAARGRANGKKVAARNSAGAARPARSSAPASRGAAAEQAIGQWQRDGMRGDQDYYHVPGAGNPPDRSADSRRRGVAEAEGQAEAAPQAPREVALLLRHGRACPGHDG
jgi:hypothetical protein